MLPPFVPPSARVPTQLLPLITEFVVDRGERVISSSVTTAPWESPQPQHQADEHGREAARRPAHELAQEPAHELAHEPADEPAHEPAQASGQEPEQEPALPSIDDFLLRPLEQVQAESGAPEPEIDAATEQEHALAYAAASPGAPEAPPETTSQSAAPPSQAPSEESSAPEPVALIQDYFVEAPHTEPDQSEAALEQQSADSMQQEEQEAEPRVAEEPEPRAAGEEAVPTETAPAPEETPSSTSGTNKLLPQTTPDAWVSEERDSFNWQSAGNLAAATDEERRASEEWSSTDWEPRGGDSQGHIVTLLAQVARRVRSGELQIRGSKQMTAEAALAAVLAALLAEPE